MGSRAVHRGGEFVAAVPSSRQLPPEIARYLLAGGKSCGESGYCLRQRDPHQGEPAGARGGEELRGGGAGCGDRDRRVVRRVGDLAGEG